MISSDYATPYTPPSGKSVLTFSGWATHPESLDVLFPDAEHVDYAGATSLEAVAGILKRREYDIVAGWSLGGVIAREMLEEGAIRAKAFISIAAPVQFVRSTSLHYAMPEDTFALFAQNYGIDPQRTARRFAGLIAKRDIHEKKVREAVRLHPFSESPAHWAHWLLHLKDHTARARYHQLPPSLILHGSDDTIVPHQQAELLSSRLRHADRELLDWCGHAPHLHSPERCTAVISRFIEKVLK